MDEQLIQELLASVLPEKETVYSLSEEKRLTEESLAPPPLDLELPDARQEADPSAPAPVLEAEESSAASGDALLLSAPLE